LKVKWTPPGNNGGCSVTDYFILCEQEDGTSIACATAADFSDKPNLFEYTLDMTGHTGETVKIKLQVTNQIGTTTSASYLSALVAGLPTIGGAVIENEDTSGTQISFSLPDDACQSDTLY